MARKKVKRGKKKKQSYEGDLSTVSAEMGTGYEDTAWKDSIETESKGYQYLPKKEGMWQKAKNVGHAVKVSRPGKWAKRNIGEGMYDGTIKPIGAGTKKALGFTRDVYYDTAYHVFRDEFGRPIKQLTKQFAKNADTRAEAEENLLKKKGQVKREAIAFNREMKQAQMEQRHSKKMERRKEAMEEGKTGFWARRGVFGKTEKDVKQESKRLGNLRKTSGKGVYWSDYSRGDAVQGRKIVKSFEGGKPHYIENYQDVKKKIKSIRNSSDSDKQKNRKIRQLRKAWNFYQKQQRLKERTGKLGSFIKGHTYGKEARESWLQRAKGFTDYGSRNIERTFSGVGTLGEAISTGASKSVSPIQIFQMAWGRLSVTLKALVIFVIFAAVLFIPWGIFYYTGWAIAAAFMFLISLVFWLMISVLNGVAFVAVTVVNGVVTIIMRVVIFLVEAILGFLVRDMTKIIPNPNWASRYDGDPWAAEAFDTAQTSLAQGEIATSPYAMEVPNNYWYQGHLLLQGTLIDYSQIATIPSLMVAEAPNWTDAMNVTLVSKLIALLGLDNIAGEFEHWISIGVGNAFEGFIDFAPPWMVVLVGLLPAIILAVGVYWYYRKNKHKIEAGQADMY